MESKERLSAKYNAQPKNPWNNPPKIVATDTQTFANLGTTPLEHSQLTDCMTKLELEFKTQLTQLNQEKQAESKKNKSTIRELKQEVQTLKGAHSRIEGTQEKQRVTLIEYEKRITDAMNDCKKNATAIETVQTDVKTLASKIDSNTDELRAELKNEMKSQTDTILAQFAQIRAFFGGQAVTTVTQDENDETKRKEQELEEDLIDDNENNVQAGTGKKLKTKAAATKEAENIKDGWEHEMNETKMDDSDDDKDTLMTGSAITKEIK